MTQAPAYTLRAAEPRDLQDLVRLIAALADYEKLTHLLDATPEKLAPHLFGDKPVAEAMVAELADGSVVGFALYFTNFSTFLCRPGLYLEDLYVRPAFRKLGLGRRLLQAVAQVAVERRCARYEWSVLDWNAPAIAFYERVGARMSPDWRRMRMEGSSLERFGSGAARE